MAYSNTLLNEIYDKTDGRCHCCHKKVAFVNYGHPGSRGAWEVDHSVPVARGGSNGPRNLYPACIQCNRRKQTFSSHSMRARFGKSMAPLSIEKEEDLRISNAMAGAAVGAVLGGFAGLAFGRLGLPLAGLLIGGALAYKTDPYKQ